MSVPTGKRIFAIAKDDRLRTLIIGPESLDIEDIADRYADNEIDEINEPYVQDLDAFVTRLCSDYGCSRVPFVEFDSDYHTLIQ